MKTNQNMFWARNLTTYQVLFFSDQLDQQLALHENLLGLWHSYVDSHFNWTSPWLYWKPLFMKTNQNMFWARNLTTYQVLFFSDQLDQQLALHENLLGLWHSSVDSQFNWTSPWLYWKPLFLKRHKNMFWARNLTTYQVLFLRPARSTISSPWKPTRTVTLLRRPSVQLNNSLTLLKTTFFENAPEFFWARNLTTYKVLFPQTS